MLACWTRHDKLGQELPARPSHSAGHLLAKLGSQHAQGHQRTLGFAIPGNAAVEPNAVIELLGVTENQPRCDADALLQRAHMKFLCIDPPRQTHPKNEAAGRPGHLCAFREILLHLSLIHI